MFNFAVNELVGQILQLFFTFCRKCCKEIFKIVSRTKVIMFPEMKQIYYC